MELIKVTKTRWERDRGTFIALHLTLEVEGRKLNMNYSNEEELDEWLKDDFFKDNELVGLKIEFMEELWMNKELYANAHLVKDLVADRLWPIEPEVATKLLN